MVFFFILLRGNSFDSSIRENIAERKYRALKSQEEVLNHKDFSLQTLIDHKFDANNKALFSLPDYDRKKKVSIFKKINIDELEQIYLKNNSYFISLMRKRKRNVYEVSFKENLEILAKYNYRLKDIVLQEQYKNFEDLFGEKWWEEENYADQQKIVNGLLKLKDNKKYKKIVKSNVNLENYLDVFDNLIENIIDDEDGETLNSEGLNNKDEDGKTLNSEDLNNNREQVKKKKQKERWLFFAVVFVLLLATASILIYLKKRREAMNSKLNVCDDSESKNSTLKANNKSYGSKNRPSEDNSKSLEGEIKELKSTNESLKSKNSELETTNKSLNSKITKLESFKKKIVDISNLNNINKTKFLLNPGDYIGKLINDLSILCPSTKSNIPLTDQAKVLSDKIESYNDIISSLNIKDGNIEGIQSKLFQFHLIQKKMKEFFNINSNYDTGLEKIKNDYEDKDSKIFSLEKEVNKKKISEYKNLIHFLIIGNNQSKSKTSVLFNKFQKKTLSYTTFIVSCIFNSPKNDIIEFFEEGNVIDTMKLIYVEFYRFYSFLSVLNDIDVSIELQDKFKEDKLIFNVLYEFLDKFNHDDNVRIEVEYSKPFIDTFDDNIHGGQGLAKTFNEIDMVENELREQKKLPINTILEIQQPKIKSEKINEFTYTEIKVYYYQL